MQLAEMKDIYEYLEFSNHSLKNFQFLVPEVKASYLYAYTF